MNDFPILITNKLTLRKLRLSDFDSLIYHINNKNISDQIFNIPFPYTEEDAISRMNLINSGFKEKKRFIFAITETNAGSVIGEIGMHLDKDNNRAEIGYWLGEIFWGKGYISEVINAVVEFGFDELGLNKIWATHYPENPASGRVLQKAGMKKEGEFKEHYLINGVYRSVIQYCITATDYKA